MVQYTGLYQSHIELHEQRAREWASKGKPDYAAGSMKKAAKWKAKQAAWDGFMSPQPRNELERLFMDKMKQAEADLLGLFEEEVFRG